MSKEEEFLEELTYPNRGKVREHIQHWVTGLKPEGIIDKQVDVEDNCHIVTITADDKNRLSRIDLAFTLYFSPSYRYGYAYVEDSIWRIKKDPGVLTMRYGPAIEHDFQTVYQRQYIVKEYQ